MYLPEASIRLVALIRSGLLRLDNFDVTTFELDNANEAVAHAAANHGPFKMTAIRPGRSARPRFNREKRCQTACKPGSVPALRRGMAIPLGRPLPDASRDRPGWQDGNVPGPKARHPYLVLLPVGFALPLPLPAARCALTAPFHPCRPAMPSVAVCFCGTFPKVALAGR